MTCFDFADPKNKPKSYDKTNLAERLTSADFQTGSFSVGHEYTVERKRRKNNEMGNGH